MKSKTLEINEEYEENVPTGVEAEKNEEESTEVTKPWNPKQIRVDPKVFSIRQIIDMIQDRELELVPDFQRKNVWGSKQKSRLIESMLLRIPLPAFYFSADDTGKLQVVDGLQRLSAIYDYVKGGKDGSKIYALSDLEYLNNEVGNKYYKNIEHSIWARRINTTQINVNIIDPDTPAQVKFDIFKRINTGGSPLNAQEIRHCMSKNRSREFLKRLSNKECFSKATNYKLKEHIRMADKEIILRFCAFRLLKTISDYANTSSMDEFLTNTTSKIDDALTEHDLKKLESNFEIAMINSYILFKDHCFMKWPEYSDDKNPINRALFEVWGVILSDYDSEELKKYRVQIVKEFRKMMTEDYDFLDSISTSTNTYSKVERRFSKIKGLLKKVIL